MPRFLSSSRSLLIFSLFSLPHLSLSLFLSRSFARSLALVAPLLPHSSEFLGLRRTKRVINAPQHLAKFTLVRLFPGGLPRRGREKEKACGACIYTSKVKINPRESYLFATLVVCLPDLAKESGSDCETRRTDGRVVVNLIEHDTQSLFPARS